VTLLPLRAADVNVNVDVDVNVDGATHGSTSSR